MKIEKITFGSLPFRMFRNLEIPISERLTVIAGHNGIGKSTLLGLIANGSELKTSFGKTLFNRAFQAQFHELFYLDEERDYVEERNKKPSFQLHYINEAGQRLVKEFKVSRHGDKKKGEKRLKVVPRGSAEGWDVGNEAKVPIPTLFLSMSRMSPIGEFPEELKAQLERKMGDEDRFYIRERFKAIIDHKVLDTSNINKHELSGTTKRSFLPEFDHSSRTISLGQDSLSSIITALASFNHLKRNWSDYKGGILLIDEIDAGFHPRAQIKIIELLKKEARNLKLQIIMTSHSLTICQEVLKISDETARGGRNIDNVVYIQDVLRPHLMEHVSYDTIKRDMLNQLPKPQPQKPKVKIYFEDDEAKWFFEQLLPLYNFDCVKLYSHELCLISAKLGCNNLYQLYSKDDYFKTLVIVFDADVLMEEEIKPLISSEKTVLCLPSSSTETEDKEMLTPEYQIYNFLAELLQDLDHPFWSQLPEGYHRENFKDEIIDTFPHQSGDQKLRVVRKDWFREHRFHFEDAHVVKFFVEENKRNVDIFMNDLRTAIEHIIGN